MSKWIDADALYDEVKKREETARQWVLDTPSSFNGNPNPAAIRYAAILGERTTMMHMIFDAPAADVAPVRRGEWADDASCPFCGFKPWYENDIHTLSFCPNCGAKMDGGEE